jgi:hypothetical protein
MPLQPIPEWGSGEDLRKYLEKLRRMANLAADLVADDWLVVEETPNGRTISFNTDKLFNDLGLAPIQAFVILTVTQDIVVTPSATNMRWAYTANKARKIAVGHGGWAINTDDVDDQAVQHEYDIYSNLESTNGEMTAGVTFGNGVPADDIIDAGGSFTLKNAPVGAIVYCKKEVISTGSPPAVIQTVEWQIVNFNNAVSGQC